jgi:hypothetical protein
VNIAHVSVSGLRRCYPSAEALSAALLGVSWASGAPREYI